MREAAGPGEKDKGVTQWSVDTLRTDGLRVVVTAFNTADQNGPATRPAPALTHGSARKIAARPGVEPDGLHRLIRRLIGRSPGPPHLASA